MDAVEGNMFGLSPDEVARYQDRFRTLERVRYEERAMALRMRIAGFLGGLDALIDNEGIAFFDYPLDDDIPGSTLLQDLRTVHAQVWVEQTRSIVDLCIDAQDTILFPALRVVKNDSFYDPEKDRFFIVSADVIIDHEHDASLHYAVAEYLANENAMGVADTFPAVVRSGEDGKNKRLHDVNGITRIEVIEDDGGIQYFAEFNPYDMRFALDIAEQILDEVVDLQPVYIFRVDE